MFARIGVMRPLNRHVERVFEAGAGSMTQSGIVAASILTALLTSRPIISAIARSAGRISTCAI
jgi:hypothetical protein